MGVGTQLTVSILFTQDSGPLDGGTHSPNVDTPFLVHLEINQYKLQK